MPNRQPHVRRRRKSGEAMAMRHGSARSEGHSVKELGVEEFGGRCAEVTRD